MIYMKNKVLLLFLAIFMVLFIIVGCTAQKAPTAPQKTPEKTPETQKEITQTENKIPGTKSPAYKDGEYKAELEPDSHGWRSVVEIEVKNGKITDVDYDELNKDDKEKSEDKEYNQQWESASGINAKKAYPQLEERLMETQDIEEVDIITGATDATENFKEVVTEALKEAVQ